MSYAYLGDAYSIKPILERQRWMLEATPMNPYKRAYTDYQIDGNLSLDDIGLYKYQHNHNNLRAIAISGADCPQGQHVNGRGECVDVCMSNQECPLGYSCKNGHCERDKCNDDSDCGSGYCYSQPELKDFQQYCVPTSCGEIANGDCIQTATGNFLGRNPESPFLLRQAISTLYGVRAAQY
jgi:hypothetical protein